MGNTEAAGNIERLRGRMDENEEFRIEARQAIEDINTAREQANRAGAIARLLASGSADNIQAVIDQAPALIEEFEGAFNTAKVNFDNLFASGNLLNSKI